MGRACSEGACSAARLEQLKILFGFDACVLGAKSRVALRLRHGCRRHSPSLAALRAAAAARRCARGTAHRGPNKLLWLAHDNVAACAHTGGAVHVAATLQPAAGRSVQRSQRGRQSRSSPHRRARQRAAAARGMAATSAKRYAQCHRALNLPLNPRARGDTASRPQEPQHAAAAHTRPRISSDAAAGEAAADVRGAGGARRAERRRATIPAPPPDRLRQAQGASPTRMPHPRPLPLQSSNGARRRSSGARRC